MTDYNPALNPDAQRLPLLEALVGRTVYVLADDEDPTSFDAVDPTTAARVPSILWQGIRFDFVDGDATSAHDGLTVIVTADGGRYHAAGIQFPIRSVLSRSENDPPGDPEFGDAYIVGSAPTGDWADHGEEIAVYTARGWQFKTPQPGDFVLVTDIDETWRVDAEGDWVRGFGISSTSPETIPPSAIIGEGGRVRWIVENQTTNDPPGSVGEGVGYIVGPAPTGAWAGHTGKVAHGENGAWVLYDPAHGWEAFDRAGGANYVYRPAAGGWVSAAGSYSDVVVGLDNAQAALSAAGNNNRGYAFTATTPPTSTTNRRCLETLTIDIQADRVGQMFEVEYFCDAINNLTVGGTTAVASVYVTAGLFVDSESNARDWQRLPKIKYNGLNEVSGGSNAVLTQPAMPGLFVKFLITLNDVSSHTLSIIMFPRNDVTGDASPTITGGNITVRRRRLIARKIA